ncbi:hypothetical protein SO802_024237, partial [Lithocarpus litseifolius]
VTAQATGNARQQLASFLVPPASLFLCSLFLCVQLQVEIAKNLLLLGETTTILFFFLYKS